MESLGEEDERTVTDLLIDQVEFADVIVLNKLDLVTEDRASEVEAILRALNPGAEIHQATRGRVPLERVLDTGLFDYDRAESSADGSASSMETTRPRRRSTGSRASPIGLRRRSTRRSCGRSQRRRELGAAYSAQRASSGSPPTTGSHTSGRRPGCEFHQPMGMWWAAMPREDWEHPDGERPDQQPSWHPRYGDRHQALVFIGQQNGPGQSARAARRMPARRRPCRRRQPPLGGTSQPVPRDSDGRVGGRMNTPAPDEVHDVVIVGRGGRRCGRLGRTRARRDRGTSSCSNATRWAPRSPDGRPRLASSHPRSRRIRSVCST